MNRARRNAITGRLRTSILAAPGMLTLEQLTARCAGLGQASHVLEILQRMERSGEIERSSNSWCRLGAMKGAA